MLTFFYDFDRDGGDFRLKVDISYFNGNLNIEDFINWLPDIDKFLVIWKSQRKSE